VGGASKIESILPSLGTAVGVELLVSARLSMIDRWDSRYSLTATASEA
jgi:hypothetical protein